MKVYIPSSAILSRIWVLFIAGFCKQSKQSSDGGMYPYAENRSLSRSVIFYVVLLRKKKLENPTLRRSER
jgi:hypothetical protein